MSLSEQLTAESKYNRRSIFKRAMWLYKNQGSYYNGIDYLAADTWSNALKIAWKEAKDSVYESRKELLSAKTRLMDLFTPADYSQTSKGIQENHYNVMQKAVNNIVELPFL